MKMDSMAAAESGFVLAGDLPRRLGGAAGFAGDLLRAGDFAGLAGGMLSSSATGSALSHFRRRCLHGHGLQSGLGPRGSASVGGALAVWRSAAKPIAILN